jgi:hypothetical protein
MRGSTSPGLTMLIMVIVGLVGWMAYTGEGDALAVWMSWPWWGKALTIGMLVLLFAGNGLWGMFDWPKRPPEE